VLNKGVREEGEAMKPTLEVSEVNFEAEVLKSNKPVLVDVWADCSDHAKCSLLCSIKLPRDPYRAKGNSTKSL
jgi:thioredoxin-like negative regulator of GroEL